MIVSTVPGFPESDTTACWQGHDLFWPLYSNIYPFRILSRTRPRGYIILIVCTAHSFLCKFIRRLVGQGCEAVQPLGSKYSPNIRYIGNLIFQSLFLVDEHIDA